MLFLYSDTLFSFIILNFSYFISQRLSSYRHAQFSRLIIRIAIAAVAISVMIMLLAVAISKGYQHEIRNKVAGFQSHIQITSLDQNNSYEGNPLERDSVFEQIVASRPGIKHIQKFANKAGIIKTTDDFQGIVLKGVDSDFDWSFINSGLQAGTSFRVNPAEKANDIVISKITASRMKLKVGDVIKIYFVQDPPRVRPFTIRGIYDTGLDQFDKLYALVDIKHVQRLNNWESNQISGYEIALNDFNFMNAAIDSLSHYTPFTMGIGSIESMYPSFFDWLHMLDTNVLIILGLMVIVAAINMITALMILILERSNMIGVLKALGADNNKVSRIFLYMAGYIVLRGLLFGNLLGLALGLIQKYTQLITLSEKDYYLRYVPIRFEAFDFVWINAGSFAVCMIILLLPSRFVSRISPSKTIRFD